MRVTYDASGSRVRELRASSLEGWQMRNEFVTVDLHGRKVTLRQQLESANERKVREMSKIYIP